MPWASAEEGQAPCNQTLPLWLFNCITKEQERLTHFPPCDTMLTEDEAPHTGACRFREMFPETPPCRVVIYTAAFLLLTLCECEHCENKRGNADNQAQKLNVCHCYHPAFFCVFTQEARLPPCKALCLHISHEHYTARTAHKQEAFQNRQAWSMNSHTPKLHLLL